MTTPRRPCARSHATTSTTAETKVGADQFAWARERRLTTSIMARLGKAKMASSAARRSASDAARQHDDGDEAREEDRSEDAELLAEELEELRGMEERAAEIGVVARVAVAGEVVRRVPDEIRRIDRQRQQHGGEEIAQVAALVAEEQIDRGAPRAANRPSRIWLRRPSPAATPTMIHQRPPPGSRARTKA